METESEFQKYELIEQYLNGTLKGEALNDFETSLNNNIELQKEVALHKDIDMGLLEKENIPFIKTLNDIHLKTATKSSVKDEVKVIHINETDETPKKNESEKPTTVIRFLKISLAIAAIFIAGFFINQFLEANPDPIAMSQKMLESAPDQKNIRKQANENNALNNAYIQIEEKNYEEAINTLSVLYQQNQLNNEIGVALGYSYLQNNQYEKAAEIFNKLLKTNPKNADEVNWYLAHTYLRNKQFKKSTTVLEKMLTDPKVTEKRKLKVQNLMDQIKKHYFEHQF